MRLARSAFHGLAAQVADDRSTLPFHRPRIAFRDIARATDSRTCIAALVPPETILTNKAPYLFRRDGDASAEAFLLGVLSSIPLDWYARRYVELGMNLHIFNGLPVPAYDHESARCARVVEVSARLAAVDAPFGDWAAEVGVPVGSVTSSVMKDDLIAELDALVALLYRLTEEQVTHVFSTFHRGWDYQTRLAAVLAHFRTWRSQA